MESTPAGRLVLTPAGRKMRDGGRPLWDYLAQAVAFPADKSTSVATRIVIRWLLEGTTPSWDRRPRIIADTLTAAGFRMRAASRCPWTPPRTCTWTCAECWTACS